MGLHSITDLSGIVEWALSNGIDSMSARLFTSEAVSRGHPDKVCDQISDAVLDAALERDPDAHVAVETLVKDQQVILAGEMTLADPLSSDELDRIVRRVIEDIGYVPGLDIGFDAEHCNVCQRIGRQSPDIERGVRQGESANNQGAGDQGIIFGYACDEVDDEVDRVLMPAPIYYAHALMRRHEEVRTTPEGQYLCPDAKSQVTFLYDDEGRPQKVKTVVVSTHHSKDILVDGETDEDELEELKRLVCEQIIDPVISHEMRTDEFECHVNPAGKFLTGGPVGDCGLTGRKIIVDTYGGMARHGGGAFSGKDPSKVDRSAAYAARYVARHVVASGWASRCELQLAYAIGKSQPVSVRADTFGTAKGDEDRLEKWLMETVRKSEVFDLSAGGIPEMLGLTQKKRNWCYEETARHGHFGSSNFPWECLDPVRLDNLRDTLERAT